MSRKNRRAPQRQFRKIDIGFLDDVVMDWAVTLTNGSGRTTVEVTGTRKSAWAWAAEAGAQGGIKPGTWYPVDITSANDVSYTGSFHII